MTQLEPMSEADYATFIAAHHAPYVADRMQADYLDEAAAEAFVTRQSAELLPEGMHTLQHRFFNIRHAGETVGSLWLHHAPGGREAFIYDIVIDPQFRRRGHASEALALAQQLLKSEGCAVLGLNVFAHNPGAQALYRKLGFAVASSYMNKRL